MNLLNRWSYRKGQCYGSPEILRVGNIYNIIRRGTRLKFSSIYSRGCRDNRDEGQQHEDFHRLQGRLVQKREPLPRLNNRMPIFIHFIARVGPSWNSVLCLWYVLQGPALDISRYEFPNFNLVQSQFGEVNVQIGTTFAHQGRTPSCFVGLMIRMSQLRPRTSINIKSQRISVTDSGIPATCDVFARWDTVDEPVYDLSLLGESGKINWVCSIPGKCRSEPTMAGSGRFHQAD